MTDIKQRRSRAGVKALCAECGENLVALNSRTGVCGECNKEATKPSLPIIEWINRPMPN